jgi:hypothetical protein
MDWLKEMPQSSERYPMLVPTMTQGIVKHCHLNTFSLRSKERGIFSIVTMAQTYISFGVICAKHQCPNAILHIIGNVIKLRMKWKFHDVDSGFDKTKYANRSILNGET